MKNVKKMPIASLQNGLKQLLNPVKISLFLLIIYTQPSLALNSLSTDQAWYFLTQKTAFTAPATITETSFQHPILPVLNSTTEQPLQTDKEQNKTDPSITAFCQALAKKLRTVSLEGCLNLNLTQTPAYQSAENRALTLREVLPSNQQPPEGKILFIGGIHGDEYAAISLTYLWLQTLLAESSSTNFHWLFLPLANPDGLFRRPAIRPNANSVDLNRNFPSPDWNQLAIQTWQKHYNSNPRRYPGPNANSEPETQWMVQLIERFHPDAIISIHAPYGLLDYDGPEHAQPDKIGHLRHRALGTYPGSLGRYAGEHLNIPVLTLELKSAGRMPNKNEMDHMLKDLEHWVQEKIEQNESDL